MSYVHWGSFMDCNRSCQAPFVARARKPNLHSEVALQNALYPSLHDDAGLTSTIASPTLNIALPWCNFLGSD